MKHYWLPHELEACWSLAADEEALLAGRTELNRLACAASLKFFQIEGRFPGFPGEIPQQALAYRKRNKKVARNHGFAGAWERIWLWH